MADWSYSQDPSTSDKDAVRYLVGDTDEDNPLITDSEINYVLSIESNVVRASAIVAENIAGKFSRKVDRSIGDYSESFSDLSQQYFNLAERLRQQSKKTKTFKAVPFAGGISKTKKDKQENDDDRVKPSFSKGLMDNERRF